MVAKKSTKRQAVAAAPAAKKAKTDPKLEGVFEAIAQATDLPESCRKMLQASAALGFATPQEERHEVQTLLVSMIGDVVEGVRTKLRGVADAESAKLGAVESRRSELQSATTAAEEGVAAASKDVEEKSEALTLAAEAVSAAKTTLQEKQELQRSGDADMVHASERKAALERGIEEHFQVIVAGTSEELPQHYSALSRLLQDIVLDESLMSALPSVCSKKSAERGPFDSMVLDQLRELMQNRIAELAKIVAEASPASQGREAAVNDARSKSEEASAQHEAASHSLSIAESARQAAQQGLQCAGDAVAAFGPEYAEATRARNEHAEKLENFQLYNIECFNMLRDTPAVIAATAGA